MEYKYCKNNNYEDFSSGRVLYGAKGIPNFPVRLLYEIYGYSKSYLEKKEDIVIYDPCCGAAYALTVLGFFYNSEIKKIYGSDIDASMILVRPESCCPECAQRYRIHSWYPYHEMPSK